LNLDNNWYEWSENLSNLTQLHNKYISVLIIYKKIRYYHMKKYSCMYYIRIETTWK